MTQRSDGGPAFGHGNHEQGGHPGMSLRDWYAGQALSSIQLRCWDDLQQAGEKTAVAAWATLAYAVADAMLAARSPAPEASPQNISWRPMGTAPKGLPSEDAGCRSASEWFLGRVAPECADGRPPFIVIRRRGWPHEDSWECAGETYYVPRFFDAWAELNSTTPDPDRIEMEYELAFYAKVLQEAKSALTAMLTLYGMDEDPAEASGAVHKQARAAVAKIREAVGDE